MLLDVSNDVIERVIVWFCERAIAIPVVVNGITAIGIPDNDTLSECSRNKVPVSVETVHVIVPLVESCEQFVGSQRLMCW